MRRRRRRLRLGGVGLALVLAGGLAVARAADAREGAFGHREPGEIRQLQEQGRIRPLEEVIESARKEYPDGNLIEAELFSYENALTYEIEFLDPDKGILHTLYFDARSGTLIEDDAAVDAYHHHRRRGASQEEGPAHGSRRGEPSYPRQGGEPAHRRKEAEPWQQSEEAEHQGERSSGGAAERALERDREDP